MAHIEIYKELGTYERHFNQMQNVVRGLASTWLLAAIAGLGYIMDKDSNALGMDVRTIGSLIALAGGSGIGLLWVLDIVVYHRLLVAVTKASKQIEADHQIDGFPQLRLAWENEASQPFAGIPGSARTKISWFYGFPMVFMSIASVKLLYDARTTTNCYMVAFMILWLGLLVLLTCFVFAAMRRA